MIRGSIKAVCFLCLLLLTEGFMSCQFSNADNAITVQTNEAVVKGLNSQLDLEEPVQVFEMVLNNLPEKVRVYPSENYYYFNFYCRGQLYFGSFLLSAGDRDNGIIYFGYSQKVDREIQGGIKPKGGSVKLTSDMGADVVKTDSFNYQLRYRDKTIDFMLNHAPLTLPQKATLMTSEEFVGPSFDESGIQFYLLFDRWEKHLFWILNEDEFVPEEFDNHGPLLVGRRTGFAFYNDSLHHRKILVGVSGWNLFQNNWFDGPFDQLPDNYIYSGEIQLLPYLEQAYPHLKGKINKYGAFKYESGRVPVIPYTHYYSLSDLDFIKKNADNYATLSAFYASITTN